MIPTGFFRLTGDAAYLGQEFGGLVTQKEFANYYLRAEFSGARKCIRRALGNLATAAFNTTLPDRSRCGRA